MVNKWDRYKQYCEIFFESCVSGLALFSVLLVLTGNILNGIYLILFALYLKRDKPI